MLLGTWKKYVVRLLSVWSFAMCSTPCLSVALGSLASLTSRKPASMVTGDSK